MQYLLLGGASLRVIGFAWFGRGDANVYALAPAEAFAKLRAAPIQADGKTAFGRRDYPISGDGESKIYWNGSQCEAEITPEVPDKSRIMAFCNGGSASDGAAAGMVSGMQRKALIEHIDAALTGRAFDVRLFQGSTASGWSSDARQPDGSYGTMVGGALKMEQDIKQMERDIDRLEKAPQVEAGNSPNVQFQPGKPMVNVNPNRR